jgi:hypothetical protein
MGPAQGDCGGPFLRATRHTLHGIRSCGENWRDHMAGKAEWAGDMVIFIAAAAAVAAVHSVWVPQPTFMLQDL